MNNKDLLNADAGHVARSSITRDAADSLRRRRKKWRKTRHITSGEILSAKMAKFLLQEDKGA